MGALVIPFEPGASLTRSTGTHESWRIDGRSPRSARYYDFTSTGEAGEFAILLRDDGDWRLRLGPGREPVRALVEDISAKDGA